MKELENVASIMNALPQERTDKMTTKDKTKQWSGLELLISWKAHSSILFVQEPFYFSGLCALEYQLANFKVFVAFPIYRD